MVNIAKQKTEKTCNVSWSKMNIRLNFSFFTFDIIYLQGQSSVQPTRCFFLLSLRSNYHMKFRTMKMFQKCLNQFLTVFSFDGTFLILLNRNISAIFEKFKNVSILVHTLPVPGVRLVGEQRKNGHFFHSPFVTLIPSFALLAN